MVASGPWVRLVGLTVRYGRVAAVDGLDLDVRPGEVVGLVGPSGAGKSSTLRVLTGQLSPAAGTAAVGGCDLGRDWPRVKSLVGYVPPLLLVSYLGSHMFDASGAIQPEAWPILAGLCVVSLTVALLAHALERCRRLARSPRSGTRPSAGSNIENCASSAAMRMSQCSASWKPAPIAWPRTAAIEMKRGSRSQVNPCW